MVVPKAARQLAATHHRQLRDAISCIAPGYLVETSIISLDRGVREVALDLELRVPQRLTTSDDRRNLWIFIQHRSIIDLSPITTLPRSASIVVGRYAYQLMEGDYPEHLSEVLTYHWTPFDAKAKKTSPHLHIGSAMIEQPHRRAPWLFHKSHLTTGVVTIPMFVRMLIEEFGITPVNDRWEHLLASAERTS